MGRYDELIEVEKRYDDIEEVRKYNHNHDSRGRFSSASGGGAGSSGRGKRGGIGDSNSVIPSGENNAKKLPGDPPTIGGVAAGDPMSFEEADNGNVNPWFDDVDYLPTNATEEDEKHAQGYQENCAAGVIAYEARLRGYDVQPKSAYGKDGKENTTMKELSDSTDMAWRTADGKRPEIKKNGHEVESAEDIKGWLDQNMESGARYTFGFDVKSEEEIGHIVSARKTDTGEIELYDPQVSGTYRGNDLGEFLEMIQPFTLKGGKWKGTLELTRVDNATIDGAVANKVLQEAGGDE